MHFLYSPNITPLPIQPNGGFLNVNVFCDYNKIPYNSSLNPVKKIEAQLMNCREKPSIKQQIRTYVQVFPSGGIDPIMGNEYEILDGNTFLNKNNNKYVAHSFNFIFNQEFSYLKQLEYMNIIGDCLDGHDQIVFADIHKEFTKQFMLGTAEDPGFVLSLFHDLFTQTLCGTQENEGVKRTKQQNITISVFSTQGNSNKFIDLILGQKFIFYSKKDMDDFKDFYHKEITNMREFLILLKIAFIHYAQCCREGDPIVFRILVDSYDEIKDCHYCSRLHIVVYEAQSKIQSEILKKIDFSLKSTQLRGEDHGSLANYLDRLMKKNKLIYFYGIPYRKLTMENSSAIFSFLMYIKTCYTEVERSVVSMSIQQKLDKLREFKLSKWNFSLQNYTHKDIGNATKLLEKLIEFMSDVQAKWKIYCVAFSQILSIRTDFYERQRFPISLQIQEFNIKSFLISKIYRLSQTYQMDDLTHLMQKLRTVKNQVTIAFRAMVSSKQLASLRGNPQLGDFVSYFFECTDCIFNNIKMLFSMNYRCVQLSGIDFGKHVDIDSVMDAKIFKNLMLRLRNDAKKVREKEQVLLRRIDLQNLTEDVRKGEKNKNKSLQYSFRPAPTNQMLNESKVFQIFKKERRAKNQSDLFEAKNSSRKKQASRFATCSPKKVNEKQNQLKNSIIVTKEPEMKNYNFCLPKIAIIHRKRTYR